MFYDAIKFEDGVEGYREINPDGVITRFLDTNGIELPVHTSSPHTIIASAFPSWGDYSVSVVQVETPSPVHSPRRITKQDFIDRLGSDVDTILNASKVSVDVEKWLFRFNAVTPDPDGTSIDLDDPRTIAGVQMLEVAGLIGPGRAEEILNA